MAFIVKKKPLDRAALPDGTYAARCIGAVGTGEHARTFKESTEIRDEILLVFEAIGKHVTKKDGTPLMMEIDGKQVPEPRTVRKEFTRSLSKKAAFTRMLSTWFNLSADDVTEFDMVGVLEQPCLLTVTKRESADGNEYNAVTSVIAVPDGMGVAASVLKPFAYDVYDHDQQAFDALPEWIQKEVKESPQWAELTANSKEIDIDTAGVADVDGVRVDMSTGEVLSSANSAAATQEGPGF